CRAWVVASPGVRCWLACSRPPHFVPHAASVPIQKEYSMKIAFVFPGQGSQSVGMLDAWADNAAVQRTLEQASASLGQDLHSLIANGPAEDLNLTTNTQPVMLAAA